MEKLHYPCLLKTGRKSAGKKSKQDALKTVQRVVKQKILVKGQATFV